MSARQLGSIFIVNIIIYYAHVIGRRLVVIITIITNRTKGTTRTQKDCS